jgi:LacI family transcriptional regulator
MNGAPNRTLKDLARHTGLSIAAVSMALRDHASLPAATIARVKRAARELSYTPDPAASALAALRQRVRVQRDFSVLALVSDWTSRNMWLRRESARQLIAGATARARAYGYELQHIWAREGGMTPARFSRVLTARGIRGVILAPLEHPDSRLDLAWREFSVVTIERSSHYTHFHHIVPNHYADMRLAWEQLRARGYTRIGLVIEKDLAERSAHQWEAAHAFEQTRCRDDGASPVPTLVVGPADSRPEVSRWLRECRPDVVISRCAGVLPVAAALRLRVPQDLGYASLNVVDDTPGVSGIVQHREVMGATAVDVLHSLLHRNHRGALTVAQGTQIDGSWRDGNTLVSPHRIRRGGRSG